MTPDFFIAGIRQRVIEASVRSILQTLEAPPGRSPKAQDVDSAQWYHSLSVDEKNKLLYIIREAVEDATFNFCCVIDGVATIEPPGDKSTFKLLSVAPDGMESCLNPEDGHMLHDILNSVD